MNAKQIEVHNFSKKSHPKALILYRLPGHYMVLGEDVDRALKSFPLTQVAESGVGLIPDSVNPLLTFGSDGTEVQVITYKNCEKVLDLPDVGLLKAEQDMDY